MKFTAPGDRWRSSIVLALLEFSIIAAVFWLDRPGLHVIVFSKTLYLAVLAALSLTIRRSWSQVGLDPVKGFTRLLFIGICGGVAMEALELFVTQPLLTAAFGGGPDLSDFAAIRGNVGLLIPFLGLTWTVGAFGEELVYRGYLLNRLADLFHGRWTTILALVASSLVFGFAHLYQGPVGIIENAVDGLILGALYLVSGRRLLVPFLAHGIQDTTDFLLIFSGHYPGQ